MRHRTIKKMLSEFVDDRLSSEKTELINNHLASCAECRLAVKSFQEIGRLSTEMHINVKPFFAQRVLANLKSRQRDGFWQVFDFIPRPVIVTGLVVSIITLALFSMPINQSTDRSVLELSMLYGEQMEQAHVTNDQALAIAINAQAPTMGE